MGYSSENSTNGSLRHARYQRLENREATKQKEEAGTALLDLSNIENEGNNCYHKLKIYIIVINFFF